MQALPHPSAETAACASALACFHSVRSATINHPAWEFKIATPLRDWGRLFIDLWVRCLLIRSFRCI